MRVENFEGIEVYVPEVPTRDRVAALISDNMSRIDAQNYELIVNGIIRNRGSFTVCELSHKCREMLIHDGYYVTRIYTRGKTEKYEIVGCCLSVAVFAAAAIVFWCLGSNPVAIFLLVPTIVCVYFVVDCIWPFFKKEVSYKISLE